MVDLRRWNRGGGLRLGIVLAAVGVGLPGEGTAQENQNSARDLVEAALSAMGGESLWRELSGVRFETIGHEFGLEQSERPEGPWIVKYEEATTALDYTGRRARRTAGSRSIQTPAWIPFTTVLDGEAAAVSFRGRTVPAPASLENEIRELRRALPDRALLTALKSSDLRLGGDTLIQGVPHRIVAYGADPTPTRILLNGHSDLPTAVQVMRAPHDVYTVVWGDGWRTYLYSLWSLEAGGYVFPRQWDIEEVGRPRASATLTAIEFAPEISPDSFRVPESIRQMHAARPSGPGFRDTPLGTRRGQPVSPIEIAPGLVSIPGSFNVTLVEQADGVVVLEAPISSAYSRQVMEEARRLFPDRPVKAVIVTSDAWLHVAGVREYVARGVPVYTLDLNAPLLRAVAAAPHRQVPDLQSERQRTPEIRPIDQTTSIGDGTNGIDLHPVHGEGGERMVAIHFPQLRILYASDLVQRGPDGNFFMPSYLLEIERLISREDLHVETVFALHTEAIQWAEIRSALTSIRSAATD